MTRMGWGAAAVVVCAGAAIASCTVDRGDHLGQRADAPSSSRGRDSEQFGASEVRTTASGARVLVPDIATAAFRVEAPSSRVSVSYLLDGANSVPGVRSDDKVEFRDAVLGGNLQVRLRDDGMEEFLELRSRPAAEQLTYRIDVASVAGLRLVANVLEFLDEAGAPRLRVPSPLIKGADGQTHEGKIDLRGCQYDSASAAPWGRATTHPNAQTCTMVVSWRGVGVKYPAVVDPAWTTTGNLTMARYDHEAVRLASGRVLVVGGVTFSASAKTELYDPASGTFAATGDMGTPRYWCSATLLSTGKVLVAGGNGTTSAGLETAELYDPSTGNFTPTGNMGSARTQHTTALLPSGRVLLAGGQLVNSALNTAELFDPAAASGAGAFVATGNMSSPRIYHTATPLASGRVLVAAGCNQPGCGLTVLNSADVFDETAAGGVGSFSPTGPLSTGRAQHSSVRLSDGRVLVAGGTSPGQLVGQTMEVFDPAANAGAGAFSSAGFMMYDRSDLATVLLPNGKVLAVGGHAFNTASGIRATAELIDVTAAPASNLLDETVGDHRFGLSATLLTSGSVLIAGGGNGLSEANQRAELFKFVANGGTCAEQADCMSGVCVDGICCAEACPGSCRTCTAGTGTCVPVLSADDADTCAGTMTCDAAGDCKLKNGSDCALETECASGQCSDAVCCDTACAGMCDSCNLPGAVGTCTALGAGSPGTGTTCSPYACSGSSGACPSTCSQDANCATGFYCASDGTCTPQKAQGAACNTGAGADCKGGGCRVCPVACVDGVCCDGACTGACQACTAALKGGGADGVCGSTASDTDPHNDCAVDPNYPASCGADGLCDGNGSCRQHAKPGVSCASTICIANAESRFQCNGFGGCLQQQPLDCAQHACLPGVGCTTAGDADAGPDAGADAGPDAGADAGADGAAPDASSPGDSGPPLENGEPDGSAPGTPPKGEAPPTSDSGTLAQGEAETGTDGSDGGCAVTHSAAADAKPPLFLLSVAAVISTLRRRRPRGRQKP